MRIHDIALIASRVLAIYVGFHAVIYSGDVAHDLWRGRIRADSLVPALMLLGAASVLWFAAPRVARAFTAGALDQDRTSRGATARDMAHIAFSVSGLIIAAQAMPLAAHVAGRAITGSFERDAAADLAAAVARIGLGVAIMVLARRAARLLIRD